MKKPLLLFFLLFSCTCFLHGQELTITEEQAPASETAFRQRLDTLRSQVTETRDDPEKLHVALKTLLKYCEGHDHVREKGEIYQLMGVNQDHTGNYGLALKYFNTSLGIFEALNDKKGIAQNENSIGVIYWYLEYYPKAIECFRKSIALNQSIQNISGVASNYGNMAIVYEMMGKYNESLDAYNKALKIFIDLDDKYSIASCYDNIGLLYKTTRDFTNAKAYLMKGMVLRQQLNDEPGICASYINLGELGIVKEEFDDALKWTNMALTYAAKLKSPVDIRYTYYNLSRVYKGLKKFDLALAYHEKYVSIKDSIAGLDKAKQIAELETKYRTAKKEKELAHIKEIRVKEKAENEKERIRNERDKQRKNMIIVILVISVSLIGIILFLIYKQFNEKRKTNLILEKRNTEIEEQRQLVHIKNIELLEKNKEITDSIRYASRIQKAILPQDNEIKRMVPQAFIFFKPKDIVSGDFYFLEDDGRYLYIAVADCTGHGVPGAFMSIVGYNLIKHAIYEHKKSDPASIIDQVNKDLALTLRQHDMEMSIRDGMDLALLRWEKSTGKIDYAAANHVIYTIHNGEITVYKGNNQPVGAFLTDKMKPFETKSLKVEKGMQLYLLTDGYADQFGGPKGKKFKYKQFEELLLRISNYELWQQHEFLDHTLNFWMGELEQNDDICVMGIKV